MWLLLSERLVAFQLKCLLIQLSVRALLLYIIKLVLNVSVRFVRNNKLDKQLLTKNNDPVHNTNYGCLHYG